MNLNWKFLDNFMKVVVFVCIVVLIFLARSCGIERQQKNTIREIEIQERQERQDAFKWLV